MIAFIFACAPAPEKKKIDLVWPLPPDQPRIRFVDMITSSLDVNKKKDFVESIFGEEQAEGFEKPYGVAVDKDGKIYVTDLGKVHVFDFKNRDFYLLGTEPGVGRVALPYGVAGATDGRIFVTDIVHDRVFVYSGKRFITAFGQSGDFENPTGIALDEKNGLIYVVDSLKNNVVVYSLNKYEKLRTIGRRGSDNGEFNYPTNIAVDSEGDFYVVDTGNFRVQVFDRDGNFKKIIGRLGDTPGSLARPKGIAIDSEDHIYVVDAAFQNFQIFDKEGNILLFVGSAGTEPGKFLLPAGIAIDSEDKIYVVNQIPGYVQIFQYLGEKAKARQ